MSNAHTAGDLVTDLLAIYKQAIADMRADPSTLNVSLLKEAREFLKQHSIELDANSAPMQDLTTEVNELDTFRAAQAARRGTSS